LEPDNPPICAEDLKPIVIMIKNSIACFIVNDLIVLAKIEKE
jgi:hypothetical protein